MKFRVLIMLMMLAVFHHTLLKAAERDETATFSLPRIKDIAKAVNISIPATIEADADNDSTWTWKGNRLRVCTDRNGAVCHIGYKLFDNSIMQAYKSPAVLRFLERYALELELNIDGKTAEQRMNADGVTQTGGTANWLRRINANTPFSLNNIPRRMYKIVWNTAGGDFTVTFPSDCQLILGGNAVELENGIHSRLENYPEHSVDSLLLPWKNVATQTKNGMRIMDYGNYLSPLVGSRVYMVMHNSKWRPYDGKDNKLKTVTNIMLTGASSKDIPLRVTLDKYGYKTSTLDITLKQFLSLCQDEGCKTYVGIKTVDEKAINGTLFIYNEALGYNHVLSFSFPLTLLNGAGDSVKARLYVYIPLHNVAEKYFNKNDYHDYNYDE